MLAHCKKFYSLNLAVIHKLLFIYICFSVIITKWFHEPWRDEYQIFGFLNNSPTFRDVIDESTSELLTPVFYYFIKILAINGTYVFYSWIVVMFCLIFLYKVIIKKTVSLYVKILLATPHVWFHWIVITRVYSILLICILILISLDKDSLYYERKRKVLLTCMNFLGIFGILMSIFLYFSSKLQLKNRITDYKFNIIYFLSSVIGISPYVIKTLFPPPDNVYIATSNRVDSLFEYFIQFKIFLNNQFNLFVGLPVDSFHFLSRETQYLRGVEYLFVYFFSSV
jgi:hypothetical protein